MTRLLAAARLALVEYRVSRAAGLSRLESARVALYWAGVGS